MTDTRDIPQRSRQSRSFVTTESNGPRTAGRGTLVLALLCVAEFMIALDFSIVNVALPNIRAALGFSEPSLQWVITAYALTFGGLLLLGGRAADLFGRRRLLIAGLWLFALASLLAGFSNTSILLVCLRAAQGAAAAMIAPSALSLLTTSFAEGPARQHALGAWGAVLGGGFVTGVVAGGVLTEFMSWRAVFFVNVPIASLAAVATPMVIHQDQSSRVSGHLDAAGGLLVTGTVMAIVFGLSQASAVGWASSQTLGVLGAALVLGVTFVLVEAKTSQPLVPLQIFNRRHLSVANAVNLLLIGSFAGYVLVVTLFLQEVHRSSPLVTGMAFLASGVAGFAAGMVTPRFAPRLGMRMTLAAAVLLQAAGLAVLITLPDKQTVVVIALLAVVVNFADVVAIVMINVASTTGVPETEQGLAGGILNTSQQVGAAVGVAVISAVAAARTQALQSAQALGHPSSNALVVGFRWALAAAAMLSLLGAVLAWVGMGPSKSAELPLDSPT